MPKKRKPNKPSSVDIFQILTETAEKAKKKRRDEILTSLGIKDFFVKGNITINKRTCRGIECKLCIKACPTNALYWKTGEVGLIEELCIYCGACVLSCIVDDCIKVSRKRFNSEVETFSKPRTFIMLQHGINARKRFERVKALFPTLEEYLRKYKPIKT
jgi:NAD-dependent dihydropyrimidine dehydrogenase PreA subunit